MNTHDQAGNDRFDREIKAAGQELAATIDGESATLAAGADPTAALLTSGAAIGLYLASLIYNGATAQDALEAYEASVEAAVGRVIINGHVSPADLAKGRP